MFPKTVVLALALCSVTSAKFPPLTEKKVTEIKGKLGELIRGSAAARYPPFLTFVPGFVRLAFHDCVGKCDGCINLQNQNNAGLENYIFPLQRLYVNSNYGDVLSVADFWALAGVVAVEMAATKARQRLTMQYKWGREDCPTAPTTAVVREFPQAAKGLDHVLEYFHKEFYFSPREVTALMGAHTLGQANPANNGYQGPWVNGQDRLDNEYYKDMTDPSLKWTQRNNANVGKTPKWQWERPNSKRGGNFMMLNTDMSLVRDIDVDSNGKSKECMEVSDCKKQRKTNDYVTQYANDNAKWLEDFRKVFIKMISHAKGELKLPVPSRGSSGRNERQFRVLFDEERENEVLKL